MVKKSIHEQLNDYMEVITKLPTMVHAIDRDGLLINVSDFWLKKMGYEREEVIGQRSIGFLTEESRKHAEQTALPDYYAKGFIENVPYQFVRKDNVIIDVLLSANSIYGEGGAFLCSIATIVDITEKNRSEELLQESELRFRNLVSNIPGTAYQFVMSAEGQTRFDYLSDDCLDLFGYSAEEIQKDAQLIFDNIPQPDSDQVIRSIQTSASTLSRYSLEHRFTKKDGKKIWIYASSIPRKLPGGSILWDGIGLDITEKKQAENEREKHRIILLEAEKLANVGGWEWDVIEDKWIFSENWLCIHGCAERQLTTSELIEIAHPEDRQKIQNAFKMAAEGRVPYEIEHRIIRQDTGKERYVRAYGTIKTDQAGKPVKLYGAAHDITERKLVEKALEESENKFRASFEASAVGMAIIDSQGEFILVNNAAAHNLGYSREELSKKTFQEITHPDDLEKSLKEFKDYVNKRESYTLEKRYIKKDKKTIWGLTTVSPVFDESGSLLYAIAHTQDITDKKYAEAALLESEQKWRNIIVHTPQIGISINPKGRVVFANRHFLQLTGWKEKDVIGQDWFDMFIPEKVREEVRKVFNITISKKDALDLSNYENEIVTKSGELVNVAWSNLVTKDIKGAVTDVTCLGIDLTERKKAEEELRQAHKMESIGTLAGGIAHDFNNILGAILGYAEMAQEGSPAGSMVRKDIDQVVKASHRAKDLVKQILSFSRQAETDYIPLQPDVIIKEALKMLRSSLPTTIDIQQDIDPETGPILADPTQIHQIINNLCTNAFHAMEETGGTLTISLKNKTLTLVDLVSEPHVEPGHFVEIIVGDTGPGIALENIDKIFDPFFTTKEVGKGTGMGLAIIHGIAKKSGGFVSCKSSPGQGATFIVYLPVHTVPASPEAETTPLELTQAGIERILFIDDEEMLAEMGKTILERLGYRVTVETNSIEALKTIQSQPDRFDLVITDQTMPGMTGSDLARRILQIRPKLPIILCTGFSNQISEEKAKIYGIKGFAMKPLAIKDLATLVRKVLDGEKPKEQ